MAFASLIDNISDKYPKPEIFYDKKVSYGTAGFRTKATDLDWVLYRMGLLAVMRSLSQDLKCIGCMITASHNQECDNGCKLVDPLGDMLEEKWESYATQLVNSNDLKATLTSLAENEFKEYIDKYDAESLKDSNYQANVFVAHDTRPSCARLLDAFTWGVQDLNGCLKNYGVLTTPQLHYMVRCYNTNSQYGQADENGYYNKLAKAFNNIWSLIKFKSDSKYEKNLYVDAANGVGADKIRQMSEYIKSDFVKRTNNNANKNGEFLLNITTFNDGTASDDVLNYLCGADHVKVQQKTPIKLPTSSDLASVQKYCSFDGDADRIVYYYLSDNQKVFHLLDGDKIATLMTIHFTELLKNSSLADKINLCIVQTAYANGSSTYFIKNVMNINASCTPTGVKHLHHEAQKSDIGVYFEANGHGTVIFSEKAESLIDSDYKTSIESLNLSVEALTELLNNDKRLYSLYILKNLKDCINQTVGDAITDLLAVELILAMRSLSIVDWDLLYTDLPSRQLKVTIKDRTVIKTYDAERRVSEPALLQSELDSLIVKLGYKMARSFVRPSGTEDVVRVYAEADTQEHTDDLANKVSQLVYDLAGGVGKRP